MVIAPNGAAVNMSPVFPGRRPREEAEPIKRARRRATGRGDGEAKSYKQLRKSASESIPAPSVAKQFADRLLKGIDGPWAVSAGHTSGGVIVYRWNSIYWEHVGGADGASMAADWLDAAAPDKASDKAATGAWMYASARLRHNSPLPQVDEQQNLVPCANVYLDIRKDGSIVAVAPSPALGMTHATNVEVPVKAGDHYVPQALPDDSKFRAWLEAAQPDPAVRALIQEQCGVTLLPGNFSVAAWWYGEAGSGKSMMAEICAAMQRQVASIHLDELGDGFGLESIVGASLIVVDEVEQEKWAESRFKSLVSGNGVNVNRKHEKALLSYHSKAKWIITSNPPPFVRDKSDGVWRRLCPVKWSVIVPEDQRKENYHSELLAEEGLAILDWMLEGARRVVQRGRFMPEHERPDAVREAKAYAQTNCDSVLAWITENNVRVETGLEKDRWKTQNRIYEHYCEATEAAHRAVLDRTPFWRAVHASTKLRGFAKSNRRQDGKQVWFANLTWGDSSDVADAVRQNRSSSPLDAEVQSIIRSVRILSADGKEVEESMMLPFSEEEVSLASSLASLTFVVCGGNWENETVEGWEAACAERNRRITALVQMRIAQ